MSGDLKYPAEQMRPLAQRVVSDFADLCQRIEIAGSLRRGKSMVGDVEIVVMPKHAPTLRARLDTWVATGKAYKARYSDGSTRWGEKYRGLSFPGYPAKVEIFLADGDNWGYIYWLRTGPGDANQYVMGQCIARESPYRAVEGYWQHEGRRLCVPDEKEMFRLLGMDYVPPPERTLERYQQLMRGKWVSSFTYADVPETTTQTGMF